MSRIGQVSTINVQTRDCKWLPKNLEKNRQTFDFMDKVQQQHQHDDAAGDNLLLTLIAIWNLVDYLLIFCSFRFWLFGLMLKGKRAATNCSK